MNQGIWRAPSETQLTLDRTIFALLEIAQLVVSQVLHSTVVRWHTLSADVLQDSPVFRILNLSVGFEDSSGGVATTTISCKLVPCPFTHWKPVSVLCTHNDFHHLIHFHSRVAVKAEVQLLLLQPFIQGVRSPTTTKTQKGSFYFYLLSST
ncbi:MAG: hypothetical protein COU08_01890 [Candidatus Harrisonbacteria bacterium CG10_big_fil_rev_8_21_14_0_10_42_17]|uniref:Uncharacterized protein n=1 Tax=Candidatus Harrisonbacteria bacterium CG10_big_fil_rev_8_21_14_0_10_42_17 TaxID=1974584 RepID=A0A2M6WIF2_9BACT|nr:MAG: hypothetical protein COU08_01890 [Candidatus Harrisonbacteria bacterium CG10_big_fil_rev_8_21_14_0_10_42_17]